MEFIKNIINIDVDGLKGINYYQIQGMYNDGMRIVFKTIDEFDYTWKEINRDGGIGAVNEEIKRLYNIG